MMEMDNNPREQFWNVRYEEMRKKRSYDGLSNHPLCSIWQSMITRCYYPNSNTFPNYGSKGISVCDRWMSLANFIADMKDSHGLTLDRRDGKGDYTPENCRWATRKTQSANISEEYKRKRNAIHSYTMRKPHVYATKGWTTISRIT